jgi:muramoyltetrapeptide carboxypeptidase
MIIPPYLKPGATVGITCPSGYVARERVAHACQVLQQWGFQVKTGSTVGSEHFYFSGNDQARLDDLQAMLDDPGIDAVLMGRGGYGMSRIIDRIDFSNFMQRPKWVCGFSDITVLLSHLESVCKTASLHSPMCGAFTPLSETAPYLLSLKQALCGDLFQIDAPPSAFNRFGVAEGRLSGGNLAILAHLTGSASAADTEGKILFIEDIGEYLYNTDRLLLNLKRAGKLSGLSALVVGSFTDMQDTERPFGQSIIELIWDKVAEYDYPVCFGLPCGHQEVNFTLVMGGQYRLEVDASGSSLKLLQGI